MFWNVQGLTHLEFGTKLALLPSFSSFDFICCAETWTSSDQDRTLTLPGFTLFHSPRRNCTGTRPRGGTCVYVADRFASFCSIWRTSLDGDILWLRFAHPSFSQPLLIACVYIAPQASPGSCHSSLRWPSLQQDILDATLIGIPLIAADLNARIGSLDDRSPPTPAVPAGLLPEPPPATIDAPPRASSDQTVNAFGKCLISLCQDLSLLVCNGRVFGDIPSALTSFHCGSSCVDYFLCPAYLLPSCVSMSVLNRPLDPIPRHNTRDSFLSDHAPLTLTITSSYFQTHENLITSPTTNNSSQPVLLPRFDRSRIKELIEPLTQVFAPESLPTPLTSPSAYASTLLSLIPHVARSVFGSFPLRSIPSPRAQRPGRPLPPFWDAELYRLRSELRHLQRIGASQAQCAEAGRRYRLALRTKKRAALASLAQEAANTRRFDSYRFFNHFFKPHRPSASCPVDPVSLTAHFRSLFDIPSNTPPSPIDFATYTKRTLTPEMVTYLDRPFDRTDLERALRHLSNNRAADSFGIRAEHLKIALSNNCLNDFFLFLLSTIESFRTQGFPTSLSSSSLAPLHKKGDTFDPTNYRGIAIIPLLAKLYASVLESRLSYALEASGLRATGQAGFRKDRRTTDNIFTLYSAIEAARADNEALFACFIDFSKAFDSIPRELLWARLAALGLPPTFLSAIQSYYSSCSFTVRTSAGLSDPFPSTAGVKQGCPLSPTLFGIYIDFIDEFFPKSHHDCYLLYADDIVIYCRSPIHFQQTLCQFYEFSQGLGLHINMSKTNVVVFHRSGRKPHKSFSGYLTPDFNPFDFNRSMINIASSTTRITRVTEYRYLGLVLHETQGLDYSIRPLISAARRATFSLIARCRSLCLRDYSSLINLFDTFVRPIALYACEAWLPFLLPPDRRRWYSHSPLELEKLQTMFLRFVLGIRDSTSIAAIYWETGRLPLTDYAFQQTCRYLARLQTLPLDTPARVAFFASSRLSPSKSKFSYFFRIQSIIRAYCGHALSPLTPSSSIRIDSLIEAASESFRNALLCELRSKGSKSHFYLSLSSCFGPQPYLLHTHDPYGRTVISRLRLSSHDLAVETSRWHKSAGLRQETSRCVRCPRRLEESEFHFLFDCPAYEPLRTRFQSLFGLVLVPNPDIEATTVSKVATLLNSPLYDDLGHFLILALRHRSSCILYLTS